MTEPPLRKETAKNLPNHIDLQKLTLDTSLNENDENQRSGSNGSSGSNESSGSSVSNGSTESSRKSADNFIGGSSVRPRSQPRTHRKTKLANLKRKKSIYEESSSGSESESSSESDTDEGRESESESVSSTEKEDINLDSSDAKPANETNSSTKAKKRTHHNEKDYGSANVAVRVQQHIDKHKKNNFNMTGVSRISPKHKSTSHKIFSFQLPFGGGLSVKKPLQKPHVFKKLTSLITPTSLESNATSTTTTALEHYKEKEKVSDPLPTREEIKLKLKRQESISSLEEFILFENLKGREGDTIRTVKKMLTPELDFKTLLSEEERISRVLSHELEGDVVIIGGYRGSTLRLKSTGERIWIPLKNGLRINSNADLVIGPKDEDQYETRKRIYPDGVITHVGPVDISKKLVTKLRKNPKVNVHKFGYDWRLALDISSEDFYKYIAKIVENQPKDSKKKGVYIVAHSMGGLVSHDVLQKHTELIRGIVYCGSPSRVPNILGPLRHGDQVLFNKRILSCEANFFMRSSLYFLPEDGKVFINDKNYDQRYDLDYFDWKTWCEYGLSPLVDKNLRIKYENNNKNHTPTRKLSGILTDFMNAAHVVPSSSEKNGVGADNQKTEEDEEYSGIPNGNTEFRTSYNDSVEYLKEMLPRAKSFLQSLERIPGKKYPPLAQVYGCSVPTVKGAKMSSPEDIKQGKYDNFYYGRGDGVVHYKWLLPEQRGFTDIGKFESDEGHTQLVSDLNAVSRAFMYIMDCEKKKETGVPADVDKQVSVQTDSSME
ncbi:hypothetical protein ACO0QE_000636 [Hanseniaspora vineae]